MPKTTRRVPEYERLMRRMGARLREVRESQGYSQVDLADSLGHPYPGTGSWVSDIERGINGIDAITLQRIADVLEYPISYFTDTRYDARKPSAPRNRNEWVLLFNGDIDRADAHYELDLNLDRARAEGG